MTDKVQRKVVRELAEDIWFDGETIETMIAQLTALSKKYGPNARIEKYTAPYSDSEYFGVYTERPETDEEYTKRVHYEEALKKARYAQYEALRKEFENNQ